MSGKYGTTVDWFAPKFRRDPNEKIASLYYGVGSGNTTVTTTRKVGLDCNSIVSEREYGPGLQRGEGGLVGHLILGGLETTLDEMQYILEAKKEKKWVPRKSGKEIVDMCRLLIERRNERVKYLRKNPSEAPKKKTVRLHLPVGYRMTNTSEPGLKILAEV